MSSEADYLGHPLREVALRQVEGRRRGRSMSAPDAVPARDAHRRQGGGGLRGRKMRAFKGLARYRSMYAGCILEPGFLP